MIRIESFSSLKKVAGVGDAEEVVAGEIVGNRLSGTVKRRDNGIVSREVVVITDEGVGVEEKAIDLSNGNIVMRVNKDFYRPAEVELLIGDASKAKTKLGWEAKTSLEELCNMMVASDLDRVEQGLSF